MKTVQGPAIFLAQFVDDVAPFNSWGRICRWAASLGYKAVQVPSWDARLVDLQEIATNLAAAQSWQREARDAGVEVSELTTHLQGQLIAVHPAYSEPSDAFAAPEARGGGDAKRRAWATQQLLWAAQASANLGLLAHGTFSGSLAWPYAYPWPPRPAGLVDTAFAELGRRWKPILDAFDAAGVDLCFELHPGEDLHDGVSFERFLDAVDHHPRANILYDPSHMVLQCMDYLAFLDHYHSRVKMFHVKDAEFLPSGKAGVYGSYSNWVDRPGRFRSVGDGQIDFQGIFSKLACYNFDGWAVLEWECCLKDSATGAKEGAERIANYIIPVARRAFDDFAAASDVDQDVSKRMLGL